MKQGMKTVTAIIAVAGAAPIDKVVSMIGELEQKIINEGEEAHQVYVEFSEWCEDTSQNVLYEIKTGKSDVESLKAEIAKEAANIDAQTAKIEELAGSIATDEADLKAATEIRDKEAADFAAKEKDLMETVDTLERAIGIIEKEMKKGGAALAQFQKGSGVIDALKAMVDAQSLSTADGAKLSALIQSEQSSDDDDAGAPAPATYENQSGGILDVLNDLLEKAQGELEKTRGQEKADIQNFEMLKQSLEDEIKFANKEKSEAATSKTESQEGKATAEGDLNVTQKALDEDIKDLSGLHHNCLTRAEEYEAETKSRGEELKALATAKQIIKEAVGGAASFLQTSSQINSQVDLANFEVVRLIRDLARKENSAALAQLASRVASTVRFGGGDQADMFGKVKGMITDMIEKLEAEAESDATEKAFCDKELAETRLKKDDKSAEIEKLKTKIEQMSAKSAKLKEEVATLQSELSALTKSQAEMDKIRAEEKAVFEKASSETQKALDGVKMALKVLNEYYSKSDAAHNSAEGASSGIIGLLEVCESDFSKALAEMTAEEQTAQNAYDAETKENEIMKVTKEQDVKYKTKESNGLDKSVSEASSDKSGVETELAAVNEYLAKLEGRCIAKAESYAERAQRRTDEIAGLKEALQILENETALIQQTSRRFLRLRRH
jgi:chromosome segregation ATPase